jgi:hypothetical protein
MGNIQAALLLTIAALTWVCIIATWLIYFGVVTV